MQTPDRETTPHPLAEVAFVRQHHPFGAERHELDLAQPRIPRER